MAERLAGPRHAGHAPAISGRSAGALCPAARRPEQLAQHARPLLRRLAAAQESCGATSQPQKSPPRSLASRAAFGRELLDVLSAAPATAQHPPPAPSSDASGEAGLASSVAALVEAVTVLMSDHRDAKALRNALALAALQAASARVGSGSAASGLQSAMGRLGGSGGSGWFGTPATSATPAEPAPPASEDTRPSGSSATSGASQSAAAASPRLAAEGLPSTAAGDPAPARFEWGSARRFVVLGLGSLAEYHPQSCETSSSGDGAPATKGVGSSNSGSKLPTARRIKWDTTDVARRYGLLQPC
jgi:hypothetical protein